MENKQAFAEYLARKRKEAGLSQRDLAEKLFVTHTTVSKWERGLSYPDITLIAGVCQALGITEHEFVTACDDLGARKERKQAGQYRRVRGVYQAITLGAYGLALLICFIVNLATERRLSWFWIVLPSILMAASLTNLPLLLPKRRLWGSLAAFSFCLYMLLIASNWGAPAGWMGNALVLGTYGLLLLWVSVCIFSFARIHWAHRVSLFSFLVAFFTVFTSGFVDWVLSRTPINLAPYFQPTVWNTSIAPNKIICYAAVLVGIVLLVIGFMLQSARRAEE